MSQLSGEVQMSWMRSIRVRQFSQSLTLGGSLSLLLLLAACGQNPGAETSPAEDTSLDSMTLSIAEYEKRHSGHGHGHGDRCDRDPAPLPSPAPAPGMKPVCIDLKSALISLEQSSQSLSGNAEIKGGSYLGANGKGALSGNAVLLGKMWLAQRAY